MISSFALRTHRLVSHRPRYLSSLNDINYETIISKLPVQFLRSSDSNNFDQTTHQRNDVTFALDTGKVTGTKVVTPTATLSIQEYSMKDENHDNTMISILWSDGVTSEHNLSSLERHFQQWTKQLPEDRVLWSNLSESKVRESPDLSMSYKTLIYGTDVDTTDQVGRGSSSSSSSLGMQRALRSLYEYGILLVTDTPTNDASIAALGASLSGGSLKDRATNSILENYRRGGTETVLPNATDGPLRTLYGSVWATSSGAQADGTSVADSAYGSDGLPLHTDSTYLRDPPGLQIFTMVQPALQGGESVFGDGFAVAEALRQSNPDAFNVLSQTVRRYHSRDEVTGWRLEASGPVIEVRHDGRIVGIRHNDLDRLPDLPPSHMTDPQDMNAFYDQLDEAHQAWDALLGQDRFRLVMKLQPGDTMVVANQRCFHGRCSFQSSTSTPRSVMGCYVAQDDLLSRMRMEGFDV